MANGMYYTPKENKADQYDNLSNPPYGVMKMEKQSFIVENKVRGFKELIQADTLKSAYAFALFMFENSPFTVRQAHTWEIPKMKVFWVVE